MTASNKYLTKSYHVTLSFIYANYKLSLRLQWYFRSVRFDELAMIIISLISPGLQESTDCNGNLKNFYVNALFAAICSKLNICINYYMPWKMFIVNILTPTNFSNIYLYGIPDVLLYGTTGICKTHFYNSGPIQWTSNDEFTNGLVSTKWCSLDQSSIVDNVRSIL